MDILILDFSLFDEVDGKLKLKSHLRDAIYNTGCFHLIITEMADEDHCQNTTDSMQSQTRIWDILFSIPAPKRK